MKFENTKYVVVLSDDDLGNKVIEDRYEDLCEHDLAGFYAYLLSRYQYELMDVFDIHPSEWSEFLSGLSATVDKITAIDVKWHPMESIKITIHKRLCLCCGLPCGLAFQYCDGHGKSNGECSGCGTKEHRHTDDCSYNSI